jgi:hypothetical protein
MKKISPNPSFSKRGYEFEPPLPPLKKGDRGGFSEIGKFKRRSKDGY